MTGKHRLEIPEDLQDLFAGVPTTSEVLKELACAKVNLELDPVFVAEYLKGQFIQDILESLDESGLSQSDLAAKLGESRQYISRTLKKRTNFTVETMAKLTCALGLRLEITMYGADQRVAVVPAVTKTLNLFPIGSASKTARLLEQTVPDQLGIIVQEVRDGEDLAA